MYLHIIHTYYICNERLTMIDVNFINKQNSQLYFNIIDSISTRYSIILHLEILVILLIFILHIITFDFINH